MKGVKLISSAIKPLFRNLKIRDTNFVSFFVVEVLPVLYLFLKRTAGFNSIQGATS
jgi:hypothetical protein